jgi:hypothetical protein
MRQRCARPPPIEPAVVGSTGRLLLSVQRSGPVRWPAAPRASERQRWRHCRFRRGRVAPEDPRPRRSLRIKVALSRDRSSSSGATRHRPLMCRRLACGSSRSSMAQRSFAPAEEHEPAGLKASSAWTPHAVRPRQEGPSGPSAVMVGRFGCGGGVVHAQQNDGCSRNCPGRSDSGG